MATPTGQISFADLNTEMMSAGSTTQLNMNSAANRLGYGTTSEVSISNLKKAWAATITCDTLTSKFGTSTGYFPGYGSITDNLVDGTQTVDYWYNSLGINTCIFGNTISTGFEPTAVTRIACEGTLRSVTATDSTQVQFDGNAVPGSGTAIVGLKFS